MVELKFRRSRSESRIRKNYLKKKKKKQNQTKVMKPKKSYKTQYQFYSKTKALFVLLEMDQQIKKAKT